MTIRKALQKTNPPNLKIENKLWAHYDLIGFVDESGTGSYCGDVFAAAVVLPKYFKNNIEYLYDGKKLNKSERQSAYNQIVKSVLDYKIGRANVKEINEINIYHAKFLACQRAIAKLNYKPDYILMDGNKEIPNLQQPQQAIVKGDTKSVGICCAGIIAKVERDNYIKKLANLLHEDFDIASNKGYHCKKLIKAIKKHGIDYSIFRKKFVSNLERRG